MGEHPPQIVRSPEEEKRLDQEWFEKCMREIGYNQDDLKNKKWLEAGSGRLARCGSYVEAHPEINCDWWNVDNNQQFLEYSRAKKKSRTGNISDMHGLFPFEEKGAFDVVYSRCTPNQIAAEQKETGLNAEASIYNTIKELLRVTKIGGKVILSRIELNLDHSKHIATILQRVIERIHKETTDGDIEEDGNLPLKYNVNFRKVAAKRDDPEDVVIITKQRE